MISIPGSIDGLPGEELVRKGVIDLDNGLVSVESLLVWMASYPLSRCGLPLNRELPITRDAELELYDLIVKDGDPDPYSKYNSLLARLGKFRRALESRVSAEAAR